MLCHHQSRKKRIKLFGGWKNSRRRRRSWRMLPAQASPRFARTPAELPGTSPTTRKTNLPNGVERVIPFGRFAFLIGGIHHRKHKIYSTGHRFPYPRSCDGLYCIFRMMSIIITSMPFDITRLFVAAGYKGCHSQKRRPLSEWSKCCFGGRRQAAAPAGAASSSRPISGASAWPSMVRVLSQFVISER